MPIVTLFDRSLLIMRLPRWLGEEITVAARARKLNPDAEVIGILERSYHSAAERQTRLSVLDAILSALENDGEEGVRRSRTYRVILDIREKLLEEDLRR